MVARRRKRPSPDAAISHSQAGKARIAEGGIYSPHVLVFRGDDSKGYAFMEKPVAAFDFRRNSKDRIKLRLTVTFAVLE